MSRPSLYSRAMADAICARLSEGEPLARICKDPEMPGYATVRRWEDENEEFRALSARARIDGTHFLADEALAIADEDISDDPDMARADVQHRKLRIDTRIRLIGKWNPKAYGDRLALAGDDSAPIRLSVSSEDAGL